MKYNISSDFGVFRFVKSSLNPFVLRFARVFLSLLPKFMRSNKNYDIKKVKVKTRDNKRIKTYLIKPSGVQGKLPVMFYFHGGAFVFKAAPFHYKLAKKYAKECGVAVVFVDYRLSYCSKFETPLNDCVDAYRYFVSQAKQYNLNTKRIAVAGDSAGGYLAVMTTAETRKLRLPEPRCQMLVYPVVIPNSNTPSIQKFVDTPCWNSKLNKRMWEIYAKGNAVRNPLKLGEMTLVQNNYIETAEFDCLHDEAVEYAKFINNGGQKVSLNETRQTVHGYDFYQKSPITKSAMRKRFDFLRENL